MITTLVSNTYKAVKAVYFPASKFPVNMRKFPILSTVKIAQSDGYMTVTAAAWNEKTEGIELVTEVIPARIEGEFETCIPARQFRDWLHASQLTPQEKRTGASEQIKFWMGEVMFEGDNIRLYAQTGNTRVMFNCLPSQEFPC